MTWRMLALLLVAQASAFVVVSPQRRSHACASSPLPCTVLSPATRGRFSAVRCQQDMSEDGGFSLRPIDDNKYASAIQNFTAPELVRSFAESAPSEVQTAMRETVMQFLGTLPPENFDLNVMSTAQNVASILFSMQMTGYMFRNAEMRRGLMLAMGAEAGRLPGEDGTETVSPDIEGTVTLEMGGFEADVDAAAYMSELKQEVDQLRGKLAQVKQKSEKEKGGELMSFVQGLPQEDVQALTATITPDVKEAMVQLIDAMLSGAGQGDGLVTTGGVQMRELLIYHLVCGYKLREMEQREELNQLLL